MTDSSALDRLDPSSRNEWGLSRAAGPTATDREDRIAQLERENAALRRALHDNEEQRLSLLRAAEARDRGPVTTNDPRTRGDRMTVTLSCGHVYTDAADDTELRARVLCDDCFDTGAPEYRRYVVAVQP